MINFFFKFKMFFLSLLAISTITVVTRGSCSEFTQKATPRYFFQPLLEVKTGYFFFSNSKMQRIYDRGGLDVQLCASSPLWIRTCGWAVDVYGAVEYFQRSGKSLHEHQKTSLWAVPINIGFKPVYAINADAQYYFTIGPRAFYIHQHNDSSYVDKNRSRKGLGFFVNTGFNYRLCGRVDVDIFGEYSHAKIHFYNGKSRVYTRDIQVGGLTFGVGLGCEF